MKKRSFAILSALFAAMLMVSATYEQMSNGAPLGNTGAPGDQDCAHSGCHVGAEVNSGPGHIRLTVQGDATDYQPGQVYNVTVSLSQQSIKRFGFQCLALGPDGKSMGEIILNDASRTQVLQGVNQYEGRNYVTYTYTGTNPYAEGKGQWTFQWKAPDAGDEPVHFYAAAVAANDDGTDMGDLVYTTSLGLPAGSRSGIKAISEDNGFSMYPNPAQGIVNVHYASVLPARVDIMDLQGRILLQSMLPQNSASQAYPLNIQSLKPGLCLVRVHNREADIYDKLLVR